MPTKRVSTRDIFRVALGGQPSWAPKKEKAATTTPAPAPDPAPTVEAAPAPAVEEAKPPDPAPAPAPAAPAPAAPAPAAPAVEEAKPEDFTDEQDEVLLRMKAEGRSWKDIAGETGKPSWALKKRFAVVKPAGEEKTAKAQREKIGKGKDKEKGKEKDEGNAGDTGDAGGGNVVGDSSGSYTIIHADANFSASDCELLARLHVEDAEGVFERVAVRFSYETGRDISEADVREKLGLV